MTARRAVSLLLAMALAAAACSDSAPHEGSSVQIVATTTILGDVARNIVGDDGGVEVLMPAGADPHDYRASARQVAAMERADLVIANGLHLEEGLEDVLDAVEADGGSVLLVGELLNPLPFSDGDEPDPHVWLDPVRMADAARLIGERLTEARPDVDWTVRSDSYATELLTADATIAEILEAVPALDRMLVVEHDSLRYFATRYGFEVVGVVSPGGSTLSNPSSSDLADLVATIERLGIPAIFTETTEPSTLAQAVASEVGTEVSVVELYTGSLGEPGSGADTLVSMLVLNAERIAAALGGGS